MSLLLVPQKILNIIGELIKARPIVLKVFKCMKCSTHFSTDPEHVTGVAPSVSSMLSLSEIRDIQLTIYHTYNPS